MKCRCDCNLTIFFYIDYLQIGLVNHSVPQIEAGDAAYNKALELAAEILPNGPVGVKMAKVAINKGMDVSLHFFDI